jgi:hypothetical protein
LFERVDKSPSPLIQLPNEKLLKSFSGRDTDALLGCDAMYTGTSHHFRQTVSNFRAEVAVYTGQDEGVGGGWDQNGS